MRIAVVSALIVLPLVWLIGWLMLKPLTDLKRQIDSLQGDDAEGRCVTEGRDDEVGGVARAFNALLARQRASDAQRAASDRDRRRLVAILESSKDFVATTDNAGRVTYLNAAGRACRGLGLHDDLSATTIADHFPAWAAARIEREAVPTALAHGIWQGETAVLGRDGVEVPIDHMVIAHRNVDGKLEFFSSLMHDITHAKEAQRAIRHSEARMASIADSLPMLVAFVDTECRYVFVNGLYEGFFGKARDAIVGRTVEDVAGADAVAFYRPWFARASHGETVVFDRERVDDKGAKTHFVCKIIPQFDDDNALIGYHFVHQDVTDFKVEQQRLSHLASMDRLTGVSNRAGFEAALDEGMQRAAANDSCLALLYLDIDGFKGVNDTYGHLAGDALLRTFAARVKAAVRTADVVARLGGDEFVVIAESLRSVDDARSVAAKILRAMRARFEVDGMSLAITASIGVALYRGEALDAHALVERADAALYRAKRDGKDRYAVADAEDLAAVPPGPAPRQPALRADRTDFAATDFALVSLV